MRLTKVIIVNKFINLRLSKQIFERRFQNPKPPQKQNCFAVADGCSNSPVLKRTLFQFYISHLNKKKLLIKRVFKVSHFICRKATLHLGGPYFLLTSLYACFPFWMLSRNHLVKQLYFDEFRKYSIVQTDR